MQVNSNSVKETLNLGKKIAKQLKPGDILCLYGELGSGKTIFTKGIAQGLGIDKDAVISPSFVLIRSYSEGKLPLYHFDLFRLRDIKEIIDLGYAEYFYSNGITVIEWADRLGRLIPWRYLRVNIELAGANRRRIIIEKVG